MLVLRSSNRLISAPLRSSGGQRLRVLMGKNQQELTQIAFLPADLEVHEAWLASFVHGGNQDLLVVDAYLNGVILLPAPDSDLLALILNERLSDLQLPHLASYSG